MARQKSQLPEEDEWREMDLVLKNRIYCDTSCRYFVNCLAQPLSYVDKERRCLMKLYGDPLKRTYINLVLKGEDGVLDEMRRTLFQFARKVEISDKTGNIKDYFDLLAKFHKILYGDKGQTSDTELRTLDVTIKRIGRDVKEAEIVDMTLPIDEKIVSDAQLCDPNSLFYNPEYAKSLGFPTKEELGSE